MADANSTALPKPANPPLIATLTFARNARLVVERARQGGHVTLSPGDDAALNVTPTPAPAAALAPVGFRVRPVPASVVLTVCRHCGMAITAAETDPTTGELFRLTGQPHHAECAAYVAARDSLERSTHGSNRR